ncbi:5'-3' exonuclease PLD3 isoform X1 [Alosa sapidissima]|uniref:5'-3' exonuclease PLD3 isoform X1 n=1 Tax=Alosa sapidissima TaxID=34773 RepID=UPI001C09C000|nr:5'-3' exonuclease PLD3 isoform X1 [Alosa sapidissima]
MGRKSAVASEKSLRRSARIRTMGALSEESEKTTRPESMHAISEDDEEARKSAKQPTSRIPTFQSSLARKKPVSSAESLSSSQSRQEASAIPSQTKDKVSHAGEMPKTKSLSGRETALPLPSVHLPGMFSDAHAFGDHTSFSDATGLSASRKDSPKQGIPDQLQRPSLRSDPESSRPELPDSVPELPDSIPEFASEASCPDQDTTSEDVQELSDTDFEDQKETQGTSNSADEETDFALKEESFGLEECLEETFPLKQTECLIEGTDHENLITGEECTTEGEKVKIVSSESVKTEELLMECSSQEEAHSGLDRNTKLSKDSEALASKLLSSPDEVGGEMDESNVSSSQSTPKSSSSAKAHRGSFALFCLLPTTLLLLGGFGQHVWLYGIPKSTSHLLDQLELHWLEGFWMPQEHCTSDCRFSLVESIPEGLVFAPGSPLLPSISQTWKDLLDKANKSVDIAAFYFTLRDSDLGLTEPSADEGRQVFTKLMQLQPRGVKLRVAVNSPQSYPMDVEELASAGAEVRPVDLQSVTGGIIHTKMWVVDKKHFYVGSANMDWRSLTQVKEVGVSVENCSCLAQDAARIFGIYWDIGDRKNGSLPPYWPGRFSALSSANHPLVVNVNGVPARVYLSSAPGPLSALGRSGDLSTILSVIADARKFIYISVMDYLPLSQYTTPVRFWPPIDTAIREAACARGVEVNIMVSCWNHSPRSMFIFLESLSVLSQPPLQCKVRVKVFQVPSTTAQQEIPFARVNHAKYMVTDRVVYIGTSNWSEGYFTQTAGVGLVVNQTGSETAEGQKTMQSQLQGIFERDWNSAFAGDLSNKHVQQCGKK